MYSKYNNTQRRAFHWAAILGLLACLVLAASGCALNARPDFSFVVLGDTRGEIFLPAGVKQEAEIKSLLEQRYQTIPQLNYDPASGQLAKIIKKAKGGKPSYTAIYRDGWPDLILTGDGPGQRIIMRSSGRKWVFKRIAAAFNPGLAPADKRPLFCLHTGDLLIWGGQGQALNDSPYWQQFQEELLAKLPPADSSLGLPGRFFTALGNHETWLDEDLKGLLSTLPYMTQMGFNAENRIYSFTYQDCRFIFLDSGGYNKDKGVGWWAKQPGFEAQMAALSGWLKQAKAEKARQVFIVYHKPSFCITGHGPLPPKWNPHRFIAPFAKDLSITVFNGHVHTTELYQVDGVRYMVLGGGGAPQKFNPKPPPGYTPELYWGNSPRLEEYNYLIARVAGDELKLTLYRYRPTQVRAPMDAVEVFSK